MMNSNVWYALRVRSNHERTTARFLESLGCEVFLPMYRKQRQWSDRIKQVRLPLFPGYLFCRIDVRNYFQILQVPGVVTIVGSGRAFYPIPEEELRAVRSMVEKSVIVEPWPFLRTGTRVRLQQGPLAGVEGIVMELKSSTRLVVCIELLHRAVAAEVDPRWVKDVTPVCQPYLASASC